MEMLLTFVLPAALFLALEFFWCRPGWLNPSDEPKGGERLAGPQSLPDWDPLALPFVLDRLDAVAAELADLEDDSAIFAKAFRTHVAQAAYKALVDDATRLANASRWAGVGPPSDATIVEIEISNSRAPLQEELVV